MPKFTAVTSIGLLDVLEDELISLGFKNLERTGAGISFETNWEGCYRANLCLRTATRIVMPVLDFPTYNGDDLYHNVRKHDFTKYIPADGTLAVDATVRESIHRDSRFVALRIKDAVVDQFREKFGERPDVEKRRPDLLIVARVFKNQVTLSIDTSGDALFKRGYRKDTVEAPVKEHIAAGLVQMTGWERDLPIIDPMCGSGTILIEAALMALKMAPGTLRTEFGFQKLKGFQPEAWKKVIGEVMDEELTELPFKFYGFDQDGKALKAARINAEAAGVSDYIEFKKSPVDILEPPVERGLIIVNPPYGERLNHELEDSYKDLGFALKNRFKGWTCWILSGNKDLGDLMGLKASLKIPVMNGPIECRFLKYEIRKSP